MSFLGYNSAGYFEFRAVANVYDSTLNIAVPVTSGTAVTLPSSQTYVGEELEVFVNDIPQDSLLHYNYVGSGSKTQISFTYNLRAGDKVRFRINKGV